MKLEERYFKIISWFKENMPVAETELEYADNFQLLVAVVLSAQCTDKRVNMVTPALFERFPSVKAMADSSVDEIFEYIKSVSYPNNKAKHLYDLANKLYKDFGGIVPDDMDMLQALPGVGRKTANVVRAVAFNIPSMPVDTHVFRVTARMGLVRNAKTPLDTERQLVKNIAPEYLSIAHHWFILHGRYICLARKPKCEECGIKEFCEYKAKNNKQNK